MLDHNSQTSCFSDFTESEYLAFLKAAKQHWCFAGYSEYQTNAPTILLRHDIDISVHRAYTLSKIEAAESISATYFIMLHGVFYNPLEKETASIIKEILAMGHFLGLHFDPEFYGTAIFDKVNLCNRLQFEKNILETIFDTKITAFSWHNPTVCNMLSVTDSQLAGMINTYGSEVTSKYSYVSDSNGIWRHRSLKSAINEKTDRFLQILTHPEWWTPEPMAPRDRILRAVNGRAAACMRNYDQLLETHGRPNIHGPAQGTQC